MTPQSGTGVWEDMVFDFSAKTGAYPTIAFMPDFEDPLALTTDITLYFDDIILNNDPNPIMGMPVVKHENSVSVYPGPFGNFLNINARVDIKSVIITSAIGQQVVKMENLNAGVTTINTSGLATGVYFVTIHQKSGEPYTLKVMKY
jgi:hypothetical protein